MVNDMLAMPVQAGPAAHRWRWAALAALLLAEAMNLLDTTIVQVAAPVIQADMGGSASDIQWFTAAYTLAFAVLLITGGRLGDIAGRRRLFRIGVTSFGLASLACALAPSAPVLIGLRAIQGAAAALVIPQTIGLIRTMFDGPERAKAFGSIGPVMGLAAVSGPVLGGVLTHADLFGSSWRAVFLVNVPLAAAVLAISAALPEDHAPTRPRLDPFGTILAAGGTALIVYPLLGARPPGRSAWSWVLIGLGVLVLVGFGLHQRHRAHTGRTPTVEVSLFVRRAFPAALAASTLFFAVMNGLMLVVVLYMQVGIHANALVAGLTLLPWSAGLALSSLIAGNYLIPRYGPRVMYAGLAVQLAGLLGSIGACPAAEPGSYPWLLVIALFIAGLGIGLFTATFFTTALAQVSPHENGSAAGLLNAVQQVGATLGVAILGSVYFAASDTGALRAVQDAFGLAAGILAVTAIPAVLMTARPQSGNPASARPATISWWARIWPGSIPATYWQAIKRDASLAASWPRGRS